MNELKYEYDKITQEREKIIEEIKQLEETSIIKKYIELTKENNNLYHDQLLLLKNIKFEEYKYCNHIVICSKIEYDRHKGRSYRDYGCIKCGLDTNIRNSKKEFRQLTEQVMYDYLKSYRLNRHTIDTEITCDLDLARAIYTKIKEAHPDIDDYTAIEYFKTALHNIRNTEVSEERKNNRIKRLSLNNGFKNWYGHDVYNR